MGLLQHPGRWGLGGGARIQGLTVEVVQGHDDVQVGTQDLAELADQGGVIGWVNGHVVPGFIPGGSRGMGGSGRVWAGGEDSPEALGGLGRGAAAGT